MNQPTAPLATPLPSVSAPTGHPRGLYTLFFTEMWERFSYYGMRGLLVLFMTHEAQKGGMGMTDKMANSIYGLYTGAGFIWQACPADGWRIVYSGPKRPSGMAASSLRRGISPW